MTKFSSEDLLKAIGLQVGDRIRISNKIFEIYISPQNELRCCNINNPNNHFYFKNLIDKEFEILPKVKHVGDLKCKQEIDCSHCPLRVVCLDADDGNDYEETLFENLELFSIKEQDLEIYRLLKTRLDKEVKTYEF